MKKKTLVCADVHDDTQALATFVDYAQTQNPERILFLGDFSLRPYTASDFESLLHNQTRGGMDTFIESKRKRNESQIKEMKGILDKSGIPYFVIPGNYDPEISGIFGENDLHKRTAYLADAKISGYGGADAFPPQIMPLVKMGEIINFDNQELYSSLKTERPQIVMSHNPPQGFCDDMFNGQNVGTPAITQYIFEDNPKLILSGHIHEAGPLGNNPNSCYGVRQLENGTVVINPGNLGRFELVKMPSLETQMAFPYGTFVELNLEDDGTPKKATQYSLRGLRGDQNTGKVDVIREIDLS